MVDRIERVTKVKAVDYDIGRPFERKEGYNEQRRGKRSFKHVLNHAIRQDAEEDAADGLPEAYELELSRATQSLFYKDGLNLRVLGKDVYGG